MNILIVENDPSQTELAMELVKETTRAQVDTTNSSERAIELISRTNYQLVIADCGSVGLDGIGLLDRVKRVSPTTSVILTSAFATVEEAVKAIRSGADEYFQKPYKIEQFKLAVQKSLDKKDLFTTGDQNITGLMQLLNVCQLISGSLEEDKILENIMGWVKRELNPKGLGLYKIPYQTKNKIVHATTSDIDSDVVSVFLETQNCIESIQHENINFKLIPKSPSSPEIVIMSFKCASQVDFFIVCLSPQWKISIDEFSSRFRLIQAQIQMTGKNIANYRGVRHLLYLDEPTSLYNSRYLHFSLDQKFAKFQKTKSEFFSVLFIDVDKFKSINDKYGHLVGTKLLFEMGEIIKKVLKKGDLAFRYGGDEFVVLIQGATSNLACETAEDFRKRVEENIFLAQEGLNIHLTVSIGVASCPEHATTKRDIIDAADSAMYAVKRSDRNKVYIAEKKAA